MDVRFVAPDWENLDALRSEAILTPFFSDERPLAGVLGLIDWRMCGFVSRMVVRGHVRGERVCVPDLSLPHEHRNRGRRELLADRTDVEAMTQRDALVRQPICIAERASRFAGSASTRSKFGSSRVQAASEASRDAGVAFVQT